MERSHDDEDENDVEIPERVQNWLPEHGVTREQFLDGEVPEELDLVLLNVMFDDEDEDEDYNPETPVVNEHFREEVQILASILRLFSRVRKFWFQYFMERPNWYLTYSDQEIIPIPEVLRVESLCLEVEPVTNSMIGFFRHLVHPPALYSVAVSANWYPQFEEFRSLVREASNLRSLSFRVEECCEYIASVIFSVF